MVVGSAVYFLVPPHFPHPSSLSQRGWRGTSRSKIRELAAAARTYDLNDTGRDVPGRADRSGRIP